MDRALRAAAAALAAALALPSLAADDAADTRRALFDLYYGFEVAAYCGLVTQPVGAGFRARSSVLESALGGDRAAIEALRGQAWQAAHAEWQNRGLGGFRGWCRDEGATAAGRIATHAPARRGVTSR